MKKLIATLVIILSAAVHAEAPNVQSGDIVQIGDFQYVVLSKSDFERMRLAMDDLRAKWSCLNSNETGRVALHGRRGHVTITNGTIQVEYEDGYRHVEPARRSAVTPMQRPKQARSDVPKTPWQIRREELQAKRRAALSKTNEVTVTVGGVK